MRGQVLFTGIVVLVAASVANLARSLDLEEAWRPGEDRDEVANGILGPLHDEEGNQLGVDASPARVGRERRLDEVHVAFFGEDRSGHLVSSRSNMPVADNSTRSYLNGLVEGSVEATNRQKSNIAFVKTHKTASTTLAAILYRYGLRHQRKLAWFAGHGSAISLEEAARETKKSGRRVDIMHYHVTPFGSFSGDWSRAMKHYKQIMRDPSDINFVTVFREPRSHLLSYYYYFLEPTVEQSLEDFLTSPKAGHKEMLKRLNNPLSGEFGVRNEKSLEKMIKKCLPQFKLVILMEHFDEGLMILRQLLAWDLVDMTYVSLMKTSEGKRRYDGKTLKSVPAFSELSREVQDKIDNLTQLDQQLYDAAVEQYEKIYHGMTRKVEADLIQFGQLQALITDYLQFNTSSGAGDMYRRGNSYSKWYHAKSF